MHCTILLFEDEGVSFHQIICYIELLNEGIIDQIKLIFDTYYKLEKKKVVYLLVRPKYVW